MTRSMSRALVACPLALMLVGCNEPKAVSFAQDVRPILDARCSECHTVGGKGNVASGFLITSYASVMKGTKYGPVVVPGDALSSSLYRLISGQVDPSIRMPHGKTPLSNEEIAQIESWIEQGAKDN